MPAPQEQLSNAPIQPTGKKRALLVGCNYPGTSAQLRGCVNDVHRMMNMLIGVYGFERNNMRVLTDDKRSVNGVPTRANIIDGMRWLVANSQPGDILFFHFSGHGGQAEDPTYMEEDGYDETLLPTDFQIAGQIVDDEVFDIMCAPLPSGAKLTAVLDCCHSGTGLDLPFTFYRGQWSEEDNPCFCAGDIQLISGCEDNQCSADAQGRYGEAAGAMTTALCDCVEACPVMPHAQLMDSMHQHLRRRGHSQRPQLTSSQRFDHNSTHFNLVDNIIPNMNPVLGRQFRKKKKPKRRFGTDLDNLLMAGCAGMLLGCFLPDVLDLAVYGSVFMAVGAVDMIGGAADLVGGGVEAAASGGGDLFGGFMGLFGDD